MNQCNKTNWDNFIRLRDLIAQNPNDKQLLRDELKQNYFQQRLNSLSDVRIHMTEKFESNFFGRETKRFFGQHDIKYSKKDLAVHCYFKDRIVSYELVFDDGYISLRLIQRGV